MCLFILNVLVLFIYFLEIKFSLRCTSSIYYDNFATDALLCFLLLLFFEIIIFRYLIQSIIRWYLTFIAFKSRYIMCCCFNCWRERHIYAYGILFILHAATQYKEEKLLLKMLQKVCLFCFVLNLTHYENQIYLRFWSVQRFKDRIFNFYLKNK